ncbi:MAG: DNA repair protein RecO [Cyanobacteriota bacterium]|nr:DNA repair protein RecO [Cyanobacteriota bacterium]
MSGQPTYHATGINLKTMPLGESDRLVTILTKEEGLIRAVAKGSRKQPSKLGGRMEPFVVNELVLLRGKGSPGDPQGGLQRITQAETLRSFPRLGRSLAQLTAAQYLAEVALTQALSGHSQEELFVLLLEHLQRLEAASAPEVLPLLSHALFHLLALAGVAPQVQHCHFCQKQLCLSRLAPLDVHFSLSVGGVICDACAIAHRPQPLSLLSPMVLSLLQQLSQASLDWGSLSASDTGWLGAESLLRRAIEYHTERPVRSATLIDHCWPP